MQNQLFEAALSITKPWYINGVDFVARTRFAMPDVAGVHPAHDTPNQTPAGRQFLPARMLPGSADAAREVARREGRPIPTRLVWQISRVHAAVRGVGDGPGPTDGLCRSGQASRESWHRVHPICSRHINLALAEADLSEVTAVAVDETSCRRGHNNLPIAANMGEREGGVRYRGQRRQSDYPIRRISGRAQGNIRPGTLGEHRHVAGLHQGSHRALVQCRITFDKFHVVAHASAAVDQILRLEQRTDPSLKGLPWTLLQDRARPTDEGRADLDALIAQAATKSHGPRMALSRVSPRNPRQQAGQCHLRHAQAVVHQHPAVQGRADEGRRQHDPKALRRHRRLDTEQPNQRLHRFAQRPLPGRQTQDQRLHATSDYAHSPLPHDRKTRLYADLHAYPFTHSKYKRATPYVKK